MCTVLASEHADHFRYYQIMVSAITSEEFFRPSHTSASADYRMCRTTIMDTTDPGIRFNDHGDSQFVSLYEDRTLKEILHGELGSQQWSSIVSKIKTNRRGINCICGVSGGVDSSLVLLRAVQAGLRPLAVHMDNGWNDELAVANIEELTRRLGVELHTEVLDWDTFRGLQRSFFRASVPNVETVTDHAIIATGLAKDMKAKGSSIQPYGDGHTAQRIADVLVSLPVS